MAAAHDCVGDGCEVCAALAGLPEQVRAARQAAAGSRRHDPGRT
ncbi:hypothetical protein [Streptomyces sp. SD15]